MFTPITKNIFLFAILGSFLSLNGVALAQNKSMDITDYYDLSGLSDADFNNVTATYDGVSAQKPLLNRTVLNQIKLNTENSLTDQTGKLDKEAVKKEILQKLEQENTQKESEKSRGLPGFLSDYWVQFLAMIVSVIGVILAVSGFSLANQKKQKNLKKYFHEIDDVYSSYKWKSKRCEAELYRLQDVIEHQLKEGKLDENTFNILEKRIQKYLDEIKYAEERPVSIPANPSEQQQIAKDLAEQIDQAAKSE